MTSKKKEPSTPETTPPDRKKLVRFDFPPNATPEQIAAAINKLREEHGFTGSGDEGEEE